jgi:ATP-dependent phosphoenolpyruvate carboxykinase
MSNQPNPSNPILTDHGISHNRVNFNLSPEELYAEALSRGEGRLAANEALVVSTGKFTGKPANSCQFTILHINNTLFMIFMARFSADSRLILCAT